MPKSFIDAETIAEGARFSAIKWRQWVAALENKDNVTWSDCIDECDESATTLCGLCYATKHNCHNCPLFSKKTSVDCHPSWDRFYRIVERMPYGDSKAHFGRVRRHLLRYAKELLAAIEAIPQPEE